MKRKVIKVTNYIDRHANGTKGTNMLFLECGHETSRKGSVVVPEYVNCKDCDDWKDNHILCPIEYGDGIIETWDSEKQMPVFTKQ